MQRMFCVAAKNVSATLNDYFLKASQCSVATDRVGEGGGGRGDSLSGL